MKYLIVVLGVLFAVESFGQIKKLSRSELAFLERIENTDSETLWSMRDQATKKHQSNIVSGTIFTGWGMSGIITGSILMSSSDSDL
jgi:hypothetical protein